MHDISELVTVKCYEEHLKGFSVTAGAEKTIAGAMVWLEKVASLTDDGHYTILKFTTNYKVGLGTPYSRADYDGMITGEHLLDAIAQLRSALEFSLRKEIQ